MRDLTRRRVLALSTATIGNSFAGCVNQGGPGTEGEPTTPSGEIVSEFLSSRTVEYRIQPGSLVTKSELRYYNPETDELDTVSPRRDTFLQCELEIENLSDESVPYPNIGEFYYWTVNDTFSVSDELPGGVNSVNLRQEEPNIEQPAIWIELPRDELTATGPEVINLRYDVPDRPSPHFIEWSAEADPERNEPLYFEFQT